MSRERLDPKIFEYLQNNSKVDITSQAIRNAISKIRSEYPGVTLNAAAAIFAQKKGFKITRHLNEKDRQSLQGVKVEIEPNIQKPKSRKIKVKKVELSFGKQFINEANKNAELYPYIYILENSLRKLILDTFNGDDNWWENKAPTKTKEHAEYIKEAEKKHAWLPKRASHPIFYVGLEDLFKIISKNYAKYFKRIFTDQGNLRTWINESIPIRNLLAHNIRIKKEEKNNLIIRTKYICTLIEKNKP